MATDTRTDREETTENPAPVSIGNDARDQRMVRVAVWEAGIWHGWRNTEIARARIFGARTNRTAAAAADKAWRAVNVKECFIATLRALGDELTAAGLSPGSAAIFDEFLSGWRQGVLKATEHYPRN